MRLAVISDTHLESPTPWFERVFHRYLEGVDVLIHCGDVTGVDVIDWLRAVHPDVRAVSGNMCEYRVSCDLPPMLRTEAGGWKIGVTHGWGPRSQVPRKVYEAFGEGVDLICFGHTHQFTWVRMGDTWLLNPGSLRRDGGSMALVEEEGGQLRARHVVPD
ncbi:metallophosphoesterase family protein [Desulfohalovibrio reitneri]|uniref:metallophosphoesterase family protein n=1 Tax=Desulfohalovibrio reitneri TaxID=1307759 RepID=UPI0004A7435A|nr:metallophosphoesterase family protein [Desulfohalovibrio reitneri]